MSGALGVHICTERGKLCQSQHVTTLRHTSDRTETHTHTRAVVHATRDFQILLEWNGRSLAKSSLANKIQNLIAGTAKNKQLYENQESTVHAEKELTRNTLPQQTSTVHWAPVLNDLKRYNWKRAFFYRWHLWTIQIQSLTYVLHV